MKIVEDPAGRGRLFSWALNSRGMLPTAGRYVGVGGTAFLLEFATIYLVHEIFGRSLPVAVWISIGVGFAISFSGHMIITFRRKTGAIPSLVGYLSLGALNSVLSASLILFLSGFVGWQLAKILTSVIFVVWNFTMYRFVVFRGVTSRKLFQGLSRVAGKFEVPGK